MQIEVASFLVNVLKCQGDRFTDLFYKQVTRGKIPSPMIGVYLELL